MEKENENDEELTPMVDGLSSALAIMILVTTVFMMSSINTTVKVYSQKIKFLQSALELDKGMVFYNEGLSLSDEDYRSISDKVKSQNGKTVFLTGYQKGNQVEKLTYNMLLLKGKLDINDKTFDYSKSKVDFCGGYSSCIKWEVK